MPQYITPLMTDPRYQILEMHMGIDGKRINHALMEARGYTLIIKELQIIISLPVGGPDGYYKVSPYSSGCYGLIFLNLKSQL